MNLHVSQFYYYRHYLLIKNLRELSVCMSVYRCVCLFVLIFVIIYDFISFRLLFFLTSLCYSSASRTHTHTHLFHCVFLFPFITFLFTFVLGYLICVYTSHRG